MKPYAKYLFRKQERLVHYFSEYIIDIHTGVDIPDFPNDWISLHKTHSYNRALHPAFKKMQEAYQYTHAVLLEGIAFIGLRAVPELYGFHLGSFGKDGVLLRFETHKFSDKHFGNEIIFYTEKIALYFFENMKEKLSNLYYLCISGELEIDMECETTIPKIERPSW